MDEKTLHVLEFDKVLARLAGYCDFSASADLARALRPVTSLDLARDRLAETSEARLLLATSDATIGGAHDIRAAVDLAAHGGVLEPVDLIEVRNTLIAVRTLKTLIDKRAAECPRLAELALPLPPTLGLVDAISRAISERGEVLDSASPRLASLRTELRVAHDRLMSRLQKLISDPKTVPMLQEALITQRDGRYVVPLRAEFKGRIRSVIHDQSSSGATLFVEPLFAVELNNAVREIELAERDEVRRVLAELSRQVGERADDIIPGIAALAELDLAFARAKYADDLRAHEPILHPLTGSDGAALPVVLRLYRARHPLLDPGTVVPVDFVLDPQTFAVVITGPNTGGKTVSLKTAGLLALMAQSGLHLPAGSGAEISVFDAVWADIGDEQSIEQSLSTFSGHITNIVRILDKADRRALVILDELGAGTDPQEGAALARAILTFLLERGVTTLVATHYPELKSFAHTTPGVVNASLEFNLETLRPTYHLTIGLPGRSNALAIAERLGLPAAIIDGARAEIDPADLRAEDLLDEIHRQRDLARDDRAAAEQARAEAEAMRRELADRLDALEDERLKVLETARAEADEKTRQLTAEIDDLRKQLVRARKPLEQVQKVKQKAEKLAEQAAAPVVRKPSAAPQAEGGRWAPRLGEQVRLRTLGQSGVVTALGEAEAEVQIGALRVRARLADLQPAGAEQPAPAEGKPVKKKKSAEPAGGKTSTPSANSPGMEIDLRGQLADDAVDMLERYIEQAYLSGMPFVRIIHGKGTGKLRQAVREWLKGHPHVAAFETGRENEGGDGVTVAKMAS